MSAPSQIALTLRAVGGLTTAQIAAAFLVPEATMAQRISRAKQSIKNSGVPFAMPDGAERAERLRVVLHVLYLIFDEGYTATTGADLTTPQLSDEAIRLTRWLRRLLPDDGDVAGLRALMLLTDARRSARIRPDGSLVPLAEQDRSRWDRSRIAERDATDWPQILALYELLEQIAPNPMVTLNRAVAVAMVHGPTAGLDLLATLESDSRMARHHRLLATRAHLRELAGEHSAAAADYREAARRATSTPERRHLIARAASLTAPGHAPSTHDPAGFAGS